MNSEKRNPTASLLSENPPPQVRFRLPILFLFPTRR
jgi:hypothetical protein